MRLVALRLFHSATSESVSSPANYVRIFCNRMRDKRYNIAVGRHVRWVRIQTNTHTGTVINAFSIVLANKST